MRASESQLRGVRRRGVLVIEVDSPFRLRVHGDFYRHGMIALMSKMLFHQVINHDSALVFGLAYLQIRRVRRVERGVRRVRASLDVD